MKRRILSIITALALCLSLCPTWALAAEADPSLCKHHPEHTEDCGYTAPTEGHDCGHEHTAACYTLGVLPDADSGDPYEVGADTENLLDCRHSHDSACGYVQADPGAPCGYVCRICPIEDLIAALPEQVTEDNADDVRAQLDHILDLYRELDEGEQEEIDLSRVTKLQEALDVANAPMQAAGEINISQNSQNKLTEEDGDCPGHTFTGTAQTAMIYVESGAHNVTFSRLNITGAAYVGIAPGAAMNLTIDETNTIQASNNLAGIYVPVGATLIINGTGSLNVSGNNSAGIGGATYALDESGSDGDPNCGTVEINGGTVTATGGSTAAGIGGGIDTEGNPGNGGKVTINGGTVTATGGSDSYYGGAGIGGSAGETASDPAGNGGTLTINGGTVNLTAGTHEPQYPAYGFGQGSGSAPGGTCELTLADASYLAEGTTLDPNGKYTINGDPTADMIVVPELVYTGEVLDTSGIKIDDSKTGTGTYFGQTFTVNASADGWTYAINPSEVKAAGDYTVTFSKEGHTSISKTFTVAKSGTQFVGDGEVKTYNGSEETTSFSAGDTITVKATPTATGDAPQKAAARLQGGPGTGQMALYVGDALVSSEAADADADGSYTMTVSASDVLTLGGVEPNGDPITLTAKFVGNDNMADGAGTVEVNITAAAKAERDGTLLGYYDESGLDAALLDKNNEGAVFTLLDNMETELKIRISCTLDLNGKTVHSKGEDDPTLSIYNGTTVTIRGEGTVLSEQGRGFYVGGTATLEGGTFISSGEGYSGVYVRGKLIVTGENVVMRNTGNGNGLSVDSGNEATAQLSAGTYEGGAAAIEIYQGTGTLAGLLNQEGASRVAYYKDNTTLVTEGLDGKTLPSGSYTVKACSHIFGSSTTCPACGGEAVARVTIGGAVTHYGDLPSAWAAVQGQTADLYLLKSVDAAGVGRWGRLDLASGSVTLGMADGVVLSGSSNVVIRLTGGELTLNSGTIRNNGTTGNPPGLQVVGGTLRISGGTVEANWAVYINGGHAEITGGTFTATGNYSVGLRKDEGTVKISGGQFSGSLYAVYNSNGTLADLLAEDYAFKQGGAWVTDTSGDSLTGTVTAEPAPVKITAQPVNTSQRYGDMDALSIETSPGQDESVTYQWYVVKASGAEAVSGEIAPVFSPSQNQRLDVGSYQYFCEVTKDGYTQRSNTVTFTVTLRQVNPSITGTASKTYDGTTGVASGQLSITLTGVLEGDTVTATASYAYDNANAGENKTITASGITLTGADAGNYTLSSTTATTTGTITKSQPAIAFASGYNPGKTYDGQTIPNPVADNLTITGANFSDVTFEWSATPKDAGTYTLTASIPESANTEAAEAVLTVTISPKAVTPTITITPGSYEYTGSAIHPSGSAVKVMDGNTVIPDSEYTLSYGENTQVGNGSVTVTDKENGNYTIAQITETFTITKANQATLTITGAPSSVTYGDTFQLSVSGGSGTGAVSWAASGATVDNAGNVTITRVGTVIITAVKEGDSNYVGTEGRIMLDVSKKALTVTGATAQDRQYDGTSAVKITGVTLEGIVNGDTVSVSTANLTGTLNGSNAGSYTAVTLPALTLTGGGADNYTLTQPSGAVSTSVTISKADAPTAKGGAMTVSNDLERTYSYSLDQLLPALTGGQTFGTVTYSLGTVSLLGDYYTANAAVTGDKLSLPINEVVTNDEKVIGTVEITISSTNFKDMKATITISSVEKIVPEGTPTASPNTITYGQSISAVTLSGQMSDGTGRVDGRFTWDNPNATPDAGTYQAAWTFIPTDTGRYTTATGTVTITVRKATPSLSLTPSPATLPNGGTVTLTLSGLPDRGSATVTCSDANITVTKGSGNTWTADLPAGGASYTFTASYSGDGNHNGATANCTVSVEKITPTLSLTANPTSLHGGGTVTLTLSGLPAGGTATVTCSGGITVTAGAGNTWTATLPNNTATYTFTASYAGNASYNAASASCTVEAIEVTVLPNPPAAEDGKQYQVVMEDGISEVPAGLQSIETLNTPEKLETAMKTAITQANSGVPQDNTAVYDVELQISDNGGATWTKATAANFPANGLTVTLPYPAGTNSGYTFTVVHMFTTSDFNKTPGDTETPRVTNTASGLRFTVTGLSPISVGWVQPSTPSTPTGPTGGGGGGGGWSSSTYAVTVERAEHGKVTSNRTNASSGSTVTLTVTPDTGYVLDTLTVTDSRGSEIKLTAQGGGKYTFTMPGRAVTVKAAFAPLPDDTEKPCDGGVDCPSHGFTDLGTVGTWYHEAVDYVLRNNLMGGYGNGLFGPNDTLTRAQFAQILYNKEGRPAVTGSSSFSDVAPGAWCAPAITWAAERGIVGGYGNGMFGPNDNITREQLAVMLWRYAGSPAATDKELHFNDADKASGYAVDALRWAVENGVINGKGGGILDPKGLATRAQTAQMLKNFLKDE